MPILNPGIQAPAAEPAAEEAPKVEAPAAEADKAEETPAEPVKETWVLFFSCVCCRLQFPL